METLVVLFVIIFVAVFGAGYPEFVRKSKGCSVVHPLRMFVLGGTGLFTMMAEEDHPAYFMVVLVFIAVAAVVFLLNTRDTKSWVHGILMTLWQSMIFIAAFFFLIYLSGIR